MDFRWIFPIFLGDLFSKHLSMDREKNPRARWTFEDPGENRSAAAGSGGGPVDLRSWKTEDADDLGLSVGLP